VYYTITFYKDITITINYRRLHNRLEYTLRDVKDGDLTKVITEIKNAGYTISSLAIPHFTPVPTSVELPEE